MTVDVTKAENLLAALRTLMTHQDALAEMQRRSVEALDRDIGIYVGRRLLKWSISHCARRFGVHASIVDRISGEIRVLAQRAEIASRVKARLSVLRSEEIVPPFLTRQDQRAVAHSQIELRVQFHKEQIEYLAPHLHRLNVILESYVAHVVRGESMREIARGQGVHQSTICRRVALGEELAEDPSIQAVLDHLAPGWNGEAAA